MKNAQNPLILAVLLALPTITLGCSAEAMYESKMAPAQRAAMAPKAADGVFYADAEAGLLDASFDEVEISPIEPPPASDRLMIYSAQFELLVSNVEDSVKRILDWVEADGGYLQSRDNESVTCRIPAQRFEKLIGRIPTLGMVLSESLQAQDVTSQYFDLEIRIENAEKSRQRLLDLLDKAGDMEAILKIEQELRRLTVELEQMKGEIKLLKNRIAFSTVQVSFRSNAPDARQKHVRTRSRFPWVRQVGVDYVLENF